MTAAASTILIFGSDAMLLQTRRWVLEAQGYKVSSVAQLSELEQVPAHPAIRLLILCHSLDEASCTEAEDRAEARWPGIRCLVLSNGGLKPTVALRGYSLETIDAPSQLIAKVKLLMGEPGSRPPASPGRFV